RGGIMPRRPPKPQVTEVEDGSRVESAGWTLEVAEVAHVQPQLTCLAYRLTTEECTVVFGGDTAPTPRLTELARGADVLLHMCHFDNCAITDHRMTDCCSGHLDAARTARDAAVGTLVLVHITEQLESPGVRERVIGEVGQIFDGHVVFGADLLEVPLGPITTGVIR
ncbi:MAG: MBL fold metallo-hydrolase, partial [Myxococcota bacterium]|nr:MBL fold metallo-hydrolase [Myxococcota bacterium]